MRHVLLLQGGVQYQARVFASNEVDFYLKALLTGTRPSISELLGVW